MISLVVAVYAAIGIYEFVPLYKQKEWKDFGVNTVLGVISLTIAILLSLNIKIPSPVKPIQEMVTSIFGK